MYLGLYQVVHARRETEFSAHHQAEWIDGRSGNAIAQLTARLKDVFFHADRPQAPCH